jgi:hypothetical protein
MFGLRGRKARFFVAVMVSVLIFSMETVASVAEEKGVVEVARFSGNGVDAEGIPFGWKLKTPSSGSKIAIEREKEDYFLHIHCVNDNIALGKKVSFEIRKYPYLSWRWKASKLPESGDIRKRETDDQAGQIYVVFPKFPATLNTRSVGYIWDNQAPVGFSGTSTAYSKMKYVVLQSGAVKLNQWICEARNVYEDYQKLFREEPPTLGGIVLYINTQHSKSAAEIFYADILFSSNPPESPGKYADRMVTYFKKKE